MSAIDTMTDADAAAVQRELTRLRGRVDELLKSNTALTTERRLLRAELEYLRGAFAAATTHPDPRADVMAFCADVSGQEIGAAPHVPSKERLQVLLRIAFEESLELLAACGAKQSHVDSVAGALACAVDFLDPAQADIVGIADGAVDSLYTIHGILVGCGIDVHPIWAAVHANNMMKAAGPVVDGKKCKPPGHPKPDIHDELVKQGWTPPATEAA